MIYEIQWTNETYKNISSHFILEKGRQFIIIWRRDIYLERGLLFIP